MYELFRIAWYQLPQYLFLARGIYLTELYQIFISTIIKTIFILFLFIYYFHPRRGIIFVYQMRRSKRIASPAHISPEVGSILLKIGASLDLEEGYKKNDQRPSTTLEGDTNRVPYIIEILILDLPLPIIASTKLNTLSTSQLSYRVINVEYVNVANIHLLTKFVAIHSTQHFVHTRSMGIDLNWHERPK